MENLFAVTEGTERPAAKGINSKRKRPCHSHQFANLCHPISAVHLQNVYSGRAQTVVVRDAGCLRSSCEPGVPETSDLESASESKAERGPRSAAPKSLF